MKTVTNAEELGKAIRAGKYPIRVKNTDLVDCIEKIRDVSRVLWISVLASIGAVAIVCVGPQLGFLLAMGWTAPVAATVAAAGGGIAFTVLGIGTTVAAVKIANGGGGVRILGEIRSRKWDSSTKDEGILS